MIQTFPDLTDKVFISPTDTIIGMGCLANSEKAVSKLYHIKNRPIDKPFILLVDSIKRLENMVRVDNFIKDLIINTVKPTTIIYDKLIDVPAYLKSKDGSVAIRLVLDPFVNTLIGKYNSPIVSTSANISGAPTPFVISDISEEIQKKADYIFEQSYDFQPQNTASTILRVKDKKVEIIRS